MRLRQTCMCVHVSVGFGASMTTAGVLPGTWTQRSVRAHLSELVFGLQPQKTPNTDQRSLRFESTSPDTAYNHQPTAFKHVFSVQNTDLFFRLSPPHATSDRVHRADGGVDPGESHRMQLCDISASLVKTRAPVTDEPFTHRSPERCRP